METINNSQKKVMSFILASSIAGLVSKVCVAVVGIVLGLSWLGAHWVDSILNVAYGSLLVYGASSLLSVFFLSKMLADITIVNREITKKVIICIVIATVTTLIALYIALSYTLLSILIMVSTQVLLYYIKKSTGKILHTK
jgi:hypothetical protein